MAPNPYWRGVSACHQATSVAHPGYHSICQVAELEPMKPVFARWRNHRYLRSQHGPSPARGHQDARRRLCRSYQEETTMYAGLAQAPCYAPGGRAVGQLPGLSKPGDQGIFDQELLNVLLLQAPRRGSVHQVTRHGRTFAIHIPRYIKRTISTACQVDNRSWLPATERALSNRVANRTERGI